MPLGVNSRSLVFDPNESAEVMAINCGGSSLRLDHDRLVNNLGPRLKEVAAKIKQELSPNYRMSLK